MVVVTLGEGSTAQGDFHEGLNWAGIHKLPLITLVQNNQYAISVPVEKQMPVANVADRGDAYGMPGVMYDGNDVLESYNVAARSGDHRHGEGPALLEAKTYRPTPHSSDDDDRSYRGPRRGGDVEAAGSDPAVRAVSAHCARPAARRAGRPHPGPASRTRWMMRPNTASAHPPAAGRRAAPGVRMIRR